MPGPTVKLQNLVSFSLCLLSEGTIVGLKSGTKKCNSVLDLAFCGRRSPAVSFGDDMAFHAKLSEREKNVWVLGCKGGFLFKSSKILSPGYNSRQRFWDQDTIFLSHMKNYRPFLIPLVLSQVL